MPVICSHNVPLIKTPRFRRSTRAFTLVELLVVISIVSVLAILSLVVIGKVRASVQSAQCLGNLRQLGVASLLYAADNKGEIPYALYYKEIDTRTADKLAPYVNIQFPTSADLNVKTQLPLDPFRCPACEYPSRPGNKAHYVKNYWINSQKDWDTDPRRTGYRFYDIDSPSRYYYLADAAPGIVGDQASWQLGTLPSSQTSRLGIDLRHAGKANMLFMDMHVESLSADQIPVFSYGGPPWCPRQ